MESSWYYARYCSPRYDQGMFDEKEANYWLPVDQYIGGIEHAVMHLLYARFFFKLLRDAGMVKYDEPFKRLLCQGMVLADAFYYNGKDGVKVWVSPLKAQVERDEKGNIISARDDEGHELHHAGMIKMSKSKANGIDPEDMIKLYGADTVRLFMMFASPAELTLEWRQSGVEGSQRFLRKLWSQVQDLCAFGKIGELDLNALTHEQRKLRHELHLTIQKVTDDIGRRQTFNTAIAAIMELLNSAQKFKVQNDADKALLHELYNDVVIMLDPVTPHLCFKLWQILGNAGTIDDAVWPKADPEALKALDMNLVIQINGKVRSRITVAPDLDQDEIIKLALNNEDIKRHLESKNVRKTIYVKGRLVNIVAA